MVHGRRFKLYGYLTRMSESRLTKKAVNYITKTKATIKSVEETKKIHCEL